MTTKVKPETRNNNWNQQKRNNTMTMKWRETQTAVHSPSFSGAQKAENLMLLNFIYPSEMLWTLIVLWQLDSLITNNVLGVSVQSNKKWQRAESRQKQRQWKWWLQCQTVCLETQWTALQTLHKAAHAQQSNTLEQVALLDSSLVERFPLSEHITIISHADVWAIKSKNTNKPVFTSET